MSKTALVLIALLLVPASCLIAGCSSIPFFGSPAPAETTRNVINAGLAPLEDTGSSQRYPFDDIVADLFSKNLDAAEESAAMNVSAEANASFVNHIKQVRGTDLNENGDARSWTFIVEHGDKFSIVSYSRQGISISTSPGTLVQPEIFTDKIVTPRKLFEKNHNLIMNTTRTGTAVTRDLSLGGGRYTLTISGHGTPRILIFDTTTGVLISSND